MRPKLADSSVRGRMVAVTATIALILGLAPLGSALPASAVTGQSATPSATAAPSEAPNGGTGEDAEPTPLPELTTGPGELVEQTPTPTPTASETPAPEETEPSQPESSDEVPSIETIPAEENPTPPAMPEELSPGVSETVEVAAPASDDPLMGEFAVTLSLEAQADLRTFKPGAIITDSLFFAKNTMTEAEIQSFLNSKVASCRTGYTCLKDLRITTTNKTADQMCAGYTGGANESAARIIFKVAQSCGISAKVLLVMLQKEQGLVTHTWPSDWRYGAAMGQGCPDDAACDPGFAGFFNQMYGGAWQLKRYQNPAGTSNYFSWYPIGATSAVRYHPNTSCGSAPVLVTNKATAALYYYTPYQPNAAALRAGYGEGDACSAYGNRNFFNYYTDWFGSTSGSGTFLAAPAPSISGRAVVGQTLTAKAGSGYSPTPTTLTYQWYRSGKAIAGATKATYRVTDADLNATLQIRVTAAKVGYTAITTSSAQVSVAPILATRVSGATRVGTAIAASKAAYPSGTRVVYLATSGDFADALSASAAAAKIGASVLLTPSNALHSAVAKELRRLGATDVRLAGGTGVLSAQVVRDVRAAVPDARVTRASGADRYATSRAIVQQLGTAKTVYIATGENFADGLSAAGVAGLKGAPVLLVNGGAAKADAATLATLRTIKASSIVLVGGEAVLSKGIMTSLKQAGLSVTRVQGADRYETNVALAKTAFTGTISRAVVATGEDFPDALAASLLAARLKQPVLLTVSSCIVDPARELMRSRSTFAITMVGGTGVLSSSGVGRFARC